MASQKNKYIELRQERDFGQIISTTFDFLFGNFVAFFKIVFAITGTSFVLSIGILSLWMYRIFNDLMLQASSRSRYSRSSEFLNGFDGINLYILIPAWLLLMFSVLLTYVTIYCYVKLYVDHGRFQEVTLAEVWKEVRKKLWKYFIAGVVYSTSLALLYALVIYSVTIISGFVVIFVLAFIVLIFYLYLYYLVIVNEDDLNIIEAFVRSFYLIRNKWWLTFGTFMVSYLLCYVLTLFLTVVASALVYALRNLIDAADFKYLLMFFGTGLAVLGIIYTFMIFCFFIIKNCVLYYSLVEVKDSTGLLTKIQAIADSAIDNNQDNIKSEINKQQYTNDDVEEDF